MALEYLLIMRHAKSSWKFDDLNDHQRPLNGRGRRAAKAVGRVLQAKGLFPRTIWSSDSQRTRETVARLSNPGGGEPANTEFLNEFYHSTANKVLYLCTEKGEPDDGPLMLVGHNPGWGDLVHYLSGTYHRMPTGACAVFKRVASDLDWLEPQAWRLQELILPRDLED